MRISKEAQSAKEQAKNAVRTQSKPLRRTRVLSPDAPQSKPVAGKWIDDESQGCVYFDGTYYWGTQNWEGDFRPVFWTEQKWQERKEEQEEKRQEELARREPIKSDRRLVFPTKTKRGKKNELGR